jgi:hypothetical protein
MPFRLSPTNHVAASPTLDVIITQAANWRATYALRPIGRFSRGARGVSQQPAKTQDFRRKGLSGIRLPNKRTVRISRTTLCRSVAGSTPDLELAEKVST